MPGFHNKWSPSKLERGMKCPGSMELAAEVEAELTQEERDEADAARPWLAEGTLAHAVCEAYLLDDDMPEGANPTMLAHGSDFADYVRGVALGEGVIVEVKLEHPDHPEFGGTPDVLLMRTVDGQRELHVIDYKYGKGQVVSAKGNYQLRGYILLAMRQHGEFDRYYGHIFQPRLGGISVDSWSHTDILRFEQRLSMAIENPTLSPGSHCRWCPALKICTASRKVATQAAQKTFDDNPLQDWRFLLENKEAIQSVLRKAEELALELMTGGEEIEGFKVVETVGRESWINEDRAKQILGRDEAYLNVKLKTPTQLKKAELVTSEDIEGMTTKTRSLKIVRTTDRREAVDFNPENDKDFS